MLIFHLGDITYRIERREKNTFYLCICNVININVKVTNQTILARH